MWSLGSWGKRSSRDGTQSAQEAISGALSTAGTNAPKTLAPPPTELLQLLDTIGLGSQAVGIALGATAGCVLVVRGFSNPARGRLMRTELENSFRGRYPELFRHLRTDPMSVPLGRGIEVEDGWFDLIDRLCRDLTEELGRNPDPDFCLEQVKQKFGVLRVYTAATANLRIAERIAAAVEESRTTCEVCGATGATLVTRKGTMQTRCPTCRPGDD